MKCYKLRPMSGNQGRSTARVLYPATSNVTQTFTCGVHGEEAVASYFNDPGLSPSGP